MPDPQIAAILSVVQRRWRLRSAAHALTVAGAVFAAAMLFSSMLVAIITAAIALILMLVRSSSLSAIDAARAIERQTPGLDNLIVTAAELDAHPRPVRAEIRDEIIRQAVERARSLDPRATVALAQPIAVAALVVVGCALLVGLRTGVLPAVATQLPPDAAANTPPGSFDVRVIPPPYTGRKPETLRDPIQISVMAGSRIQIAAAKRDWIATESAAIEIVAGADTPPRFLSVIVVPDLPPSIRVVTPGKDTAFALPQGQVAISIQSGDDLGLSSLSLRFTRASGGGENLSFTEGEVPLRLERRNQRDWLGRADLSLEALGLADGDILVYRAIARDTNPDGVPVMSDQYLIEIGRNAEIADAGFALPTEEKKYAISQQMVIYHTEQLMQRRPSGRELLLEQSRNIAMEQRMVRAEVVFLGGGEIQDEVEEAAQSSELTEGRLQNTGRAEMLRAINAMSRAEALLNDGSVKEALVLEREALAHLERALDRRRYFLRTLPDRSRIDTTRRLTGDRREARQWRRDDPAAPARSALAQRLRVMQDLAAAITVNAALAARVAAVDPSSAELQQAAVALASATTEPARRQAVIDAMQAMTAHALKALPGSAVVNLDADPLNGRLADELRRPRQ